MYRLSSTGIISTNLYLNNAGIAYGGSGLDSLSACAPSLMTLIMD